MNDEEPRIDEALRMTMAQVFALGVIEAIVGGPVTDDDLIYRADGDAIFELALVAIARAEHLIARDYPENPQMVMAGIYQAGQQVYAEFEHQYLQRE